MYDIVIVGLGIYGSAIAAEAGDKGLKVLAVDRSSPPHSLGSSGGKSRIFRLTTVENEDYVSRARRALELWKSYDAEVDGTLMAQVGLALITQPNAARQVHHGVDQLVDRAAAIARRHSIGHKVTSGKEFRRIYSDLHIEANDRVFFEPGAFVIRPDVAIMAMLARAAKSPAVEVRTGVTVTAIKPGSRSVRVEVDGQEIVARKAILCTGPWQHGALLGYNPVPAVVRPQISLHIPVSDLDEKLRSPAFVYVSNSLPLTYYVPSGPGIDEIKVGIEQDRISVSSPDRDELAPMLIDDLTTAVRQSAASLIPRISLDDADRSVCYYTTTASSQHIVKHVDPGKRVVVVSACSGHGFKFAPAVAEEIVTTVMRGAA